MALKYYIEYNDVVNVGHRLEIYDDTFSGTALEVDGDIFLDYGESADILNTIKGSGLRVQLEASSGLTFSDLYSEYEKDFSVIYKRNSVVKFNGWINPEGWYEDFVIDKWKVSFDCIDGLSFLENLSYVDSNGLNYVGLQSILEVISNCLIRTGVLQRIRIDVGFVYDGLTETLDPFDNVYMDAIRFIKDDGDTIMSCEEVLKSTLELFVASLTNRDGIWYIHKPNQLFDSATITYFDYTYLGVSGTDGTLNTAFALGSDVDGYSPHHCSANQSIRNEKSIGGYRINYKYGIVKGLLENIYLTGNGTTIDEWTIDDLLGFTIPASNMGFILGHDAVYPFVRKIHSDNMVLGVNDLINISFKYELDWISGGAISSQEYLVVKFIIVGATTQYYTGFAWTTADTDIEVQISHIDGIYQLSYDLTIPIAGSLRIEFWTPKGDGGAPSIYELYFTEVIVTPFDEQGDNLEGEFHTFERTDKPNSKIEDVKEVFNGDNDSSIYVGAIFKTNEIDLTSLWKRKGVTESMPLLRLMGEETLRMKANTSRIFSGSVYGYFDFLSRVTINGLTGVFIPTKYSYDTKSNIITTEFKQIFGDELTDIGYQRTLDYGEVVEPTIKG